MDITRLRWIDLFTNHSITRTSTGNPLSSCTATSSPLGRHAAGMAPADGTRHPLDGCWDESWPITSPRDFSTALQLSRNRLRRLLSEMECSQEGMNNSGCTRDLHTLLMVVYSEFQSLRCSPGGWQDLHSDDRDLISRAEQLLGFRGVCW